MWKTESDLKSFIIVATLIWLVFFTFIVIFILQYYRRKLLFARETAVLNEQHVQDLLNTKQEIQQQTFQDIGREIHDKVGQRLTLASIYANQLVFRQAFPEIQQQLTAISEVLIESLNDLRNLSRSLTNSSAEFTELRDLLVDECNRINDLDVCRVEGRFADADFKISGTVKTFILRIVQEFIQNSLKHANCTLITLDVNYDAAGLHVSAHDNGQGFDLRSYRDNESKGIGLVNMRKRADLIGAEVFSFDSKPKEGTTLNIFIPSDKLNAS